MTRQKTPSVSALAVLAVLSYDPDEAVFVSTMTHEWPTRPASIAQALNRLVRQGHVVRAERHGIPYYHLAESARELTGTPAPVAETPAEPAETTAAAPAVTADEVAALKLSTTMARSLVNLVPGPVGYWGMALSARKVHGGAVEGLVRRGLAAKDVSPCTADGWCVCAGVYGDRSRPAYHYRATELGGRVAVALVAVAALAA